MRKPVDDAPGGVEKSPQGRPHIAEGCFCRGPECHIEVESETHIVVSSGSEGEGKTPHLCLALDFEKVKVNGDANFSVWERSGLDDKALPGARSYVQESMFVDVVESV